MIILPQVCRLQLVGEPAVLGFLAGRPGAARE
jgi:hypothetical protein